MEERTPIERAGVCGCPPTKLCDACLDRAMLWHTGLARARGATWAESVARRRPDLIARPWPRDSKAAAIARGKVTGMSQDERVVDHLEAELMEWAARRWAQLQRDPAAREGLARERTDRERKRAGRAERNR